MAAAGAKSVAKQPVTEHHKRRWDPRGEPHGAHRPAHTGRWPASPAGGIRGGLPLERSRTWPVWKLLPECSFAGPAVARVLCKPELAWGHGVPGDAAGPKMRL